MSEGRYLKPLKCCFNLSINKRDNKNKTEIKYVGIRLDI